MLIFIDIF